MRATTDTTVGIVITAVELRPLFELMATMMVVVATAVCEEEPVSEAASVWVFEGDTVGVNDEVAGVKGVVLLVLLVVGTLEVLEALRQRGSAVQIHSARTSNL